VPGLPESPLGGVRHHENWGIFKRHFWGEYARSHLAEARAWILKLPVDVRERSAWQAAAARIIAAADGGDIDAAALQLELALFMDGKLKL
jgi:hypothetical protein